MKKLIVLLIGLVTVFTTCSRPPNDKEIVDDTIYDTSGSVVQKWICEEVTADGKKTILPIDKPGEIWLEAQAVGVSENVDYSITFTDNPKKMISVGKFDLKITVNFVDYTGVGVIKKDPINETLTGLNLLGDGDWIREGNNLTITTIDKKVIEATVVEVTNTSLRLKTVFKDFEIEYPVGSGTKYVVDINAAMKFIKG